MGNDGESFRTGRACVRVCWSAAAKFRQRAAWFLQTYGEVQRGRKRSFLQSLVSGMPARVRLYRERRYGRCGKSEVLGAIVLFVFHCLLAAR